MRSFSIAEGWLINAKAKASALFIGGGRCRTIAQGSGGRFLRPFRPLCNGCRIESNLEWVERLYSV
jgi:hypothetical protein